MVSKELIQALKFTQSSNNSDIRKAEDYLEEAARHKGFIKELLIIINEKSVNIFSNFFLNFLG